MTRICDVCGQELVPLAGTWMCPVSVGKLGEAFANLRNAGPALTEEER